MYQVEPAKFVKKSHPDKTGRPYAVQKGSQIAIACHLPKAEVFSCE
jgi:hypothetical protein